MKINVIESLKNAEAKHNAEEIKSAKKWGTEPSKFKPRIKYYKKLNVFKASNVAFDPESFEATSYNWWLFVKVIGTKVVFNDYRYSPSTGKHQNKVRALLNQLGINIDATIEAPKGLQSLDSALNHYGYRIGKLREEIANPKSRAGKNMQRLAEIKAIEAKISEVESLQKDQAFYGREAA